MDNVIKAFIAICVWLLTFSIGRYYDMITKPPLYADKTDDRILTVGTIVSIAASIWIAIV